MAIARPMEPRPYWGLLAAFILVWEGVFGLPSRFVSFCVVMSGLLGKGVLVEWQDVDGRDKD